MPENQTREPWHHFNIWQAPLLPMFTFGVLMVSLLSDWRPGLIISGVLLILFVLQYAPRPPALARDLNLKPIALRGWTLCGNPRRVFASVYGVLAFLVSLGLLGEIQRHEEPFWIWDGCSRSLGMHGVWDAIFTFCGYGLFYSVPFVASWGLFAIIDQLRQDYYGFESAGNTTASLWCGITFFLFFDSIVGSADTFLRQMPSDVWNGWLLIFWGAFTFLMAIVWWHARFRPKENLWRWVEKRYSVAELQQIAKEGVYVSPSLARWLYRRHGQDVWKVCSNLKEVCDPNLNPDCCFQDWANEVRSPGLFEEFMIRHSLRMVAKEMLLRSTLADAEKALDQIEQELRT
jgi:hypothetical protein